MDAEDADVGVDVDVDLDMAEDDGEDEYAGEDEGAIEAGVPDEESVEAVESSAVSSAGAGRSGDAGRSGKLVEVAMVVPELEPTGHVEVDAALERLRVLSERPTGAHPDLYDGVHQRLQEVLAQIDHQDAGR